MNEGFGVLTLLAALPLVGSVVVAALPRNNPAIAKQVALVVSLLTLALAVVVALRFDTGVGGYQMVESVQWIPALGVSWTLGLDGLGLILILLSALLVPVVLVAGWHERAHLGAADDAVPGARPGRRCGWRYCRPHRRRRRGDVTGGDRRGRRGRRHQGVPGADPAR